MKHIFIKLLGMAVSAGFALSAIANPIIPSEGFESIESGDLPSGNHWSVPVEGDAVVESGGYLAVDSSGDVPTYRTYSSIGNLEGDGAYTEIPDDVVFEAKLQFSACDRLVVPELDAGSKFAIWLYGDGATTNLYVTAGGSVYDDENNINAPTNYCLDAEVQAGEWYKVTVRGIRNVSTTNTAGGKNMMGFTVFIDGKQASCVDEDYLEKLPAISEARPDMKYYVANRQLFPSIMPAGVTQKSAQVSAMGFLGTGKVDDIAITDGSDVEIAAIPDIFEITWDVAVAEFSYSTNDETYDKFTVTASGPESLLLVVTELDADSTVSVKDIVRNEGYEGEATMAAKVSVGSLHIEAVVPVASVFQVGDVGYATLTEAIAAVGANGTIKMLGNYQEDRDDQPIPVSNKSFTLDVAGFALNIATGDDRPLFSVTDSSAITIISSVEGGIVDASGSDVLFMLQSGTTATIGAASGDAGVKVDGKLLDSELAQTLSVVRGSFSDDVDANLVAEGSAKSDTKVDGYWVVAPSQPTPAEEPEPGVGPTEYATEEAAQAAVESGVVAWPNDSALPEASKTKENQAKYSALFKLTRDGKVVMVELKTDGDEIKAVKDALTGASEAVDLEKLSGGQATSVEVDAVPGLYYGVSTGETLDAMEVKSWTIATEDKVEVAIPAKGENQASGFYRLEASPSK